MEPYWEKTIVAHTSIDDVGTALFDGTGARVCYLLNGVEYPSCDAMVAYAKVHNMPAYNTWKTRMETYGAESAGMMSVPVVTSHIAGSSLNAVESLTAAAEALAALAEADGPSKALAAVAQALQTATSDAPSAALNAAAMNLKASLQSAALDAAAAKSKAEAEAKSKSKAEAEAAAEAAKFKAETDALEAADKNIDMLGHQLAPAGFIVDVERIPPLVQMAKGIAETMMSASLGIAPAYPIFSTGTAPAFNFDSLHAAVGAELLVTDLALSKVLSEQLKEEPDDEARCARLCEKREVRHARLPRAAGGEPGLQGYGGRRPARAGLHEGQEGRGSDDVGVVFTVFGTSRNVLCWCPGSTPEHCG